ncbi:MAG: hypothetical protein P4L40_26820 [Terracidiphilus sp.]|nr:hypothetical protein [Terracidiphilus sp.]
MCSLGVNLPAAQLQIAMGIPLGRIPDIRALYGFDRYDDAPLDVNTARPIPPKVCMFVIVCVCVCCMSDCV